MNKEKRREYDKVYRQKNREKIKEYHKEYAQRKKEKKKKLEYSRRPEVKERKRKYQQSFEYKQYEKEYRKKNKEKISKRQKEQRKEYRKNNKEQLKMYDKKYREKQVEIENKRRKKLGLPLIGEGWISECEMFRILKKIIKSPMVKHDRKVLSGLELDAYFPKLKLAFEYMGKQHYKWNKFFHLNKEEFVAQQYRDKCKRKICKILGIILIRIKYNEELSEQLVLSKLKHFNFPIVQKMINF